MSGAPPDDWPPIISAAKQPLWVRWRGYVVTSLMWGLLALILEKEAGFAWRTVRRLVRRSAEPVDPRFAEIFAELRPALWAILLLIAMLAVSTLASRRRGARALLAPQPAPLPEAELAAGLGLSEQALRRIRQRKIIALDVDEQGRVSVRSDGSGEELR